MDIGCFNGNFGYMSDTEATTQYGDNTMCASANWTGMNTGKPDTLWYGLDLRLENGNQEYLKAETRFTSMERLDTGLIPTMMPL